MFLTNVFFIPFMALRAQPEPLMDAQPAAAAADAGTSSSSSGGKPRQRKVAAPGSQQLPGWAPLVGAAGGFLGEWDCRHVTCAAQVCRPAIPNPIPQPQMAAPPFPRHPDADTHTHLCTCPVGLNQSPFSRGWTVRHCNNGLGVARSCSSPTIELSPTMPAVVQHIFPFCQGWQCAAVVTLALLLSTLWWPAGVFSLYWAVAGRPELGGDLAARWTYLQDTFNSNRVSLIHTHTSLHWQNTPPPQNSMRRPAALQAWVLAGHPSRTHATVTGPTLG
jgi:hypothetical protein